VQCGSDRILAAMKRGYTVLEFKSIVRRLRKARPGISITSDFIVGFPGESDVDFEATMKLVEEVNFDASFSFLFSARPGTPAAELPDDTPREINMARLERLQAKLGEQSLAISEKMVGGIQRVLVDGYSRRDAKLLCGRTENNRIVKFVGHPRLIGQFADVVITAALPNSLRGEVVTNMLEAAS
jgi:tRNA-2-methylthio-N6-dimethylallyladenosine synthase